MRRAASEDDANPPLLSPVLSCTLNLKTFGRLDLLADVALLEEGDRAEGHVVRVNGTGTGTLVSLDAAPVAGAAAAPARVDAALASTETTLAALAVGGTIEHSVLQRVWQANLPEGTTSPPERMSYFMSASTLVSRATHMATVARRREITFIFFVVPC